LEVEGNVVSVTEMGIRATLVRTRDEEDLIVPNASLVQSMVKNYTLRDSLYRLRTAVGVAYSSDLQVVRSTLQTAAKDVSWRNQGKEPLVLLTGFGSSSVDFEVSVWMEDPWLESRYRSQLNHVIWDALAKHEVTIAFPQLDIHFDDPALLPKAS
jgi:small-conductance mechanosensitive channel